MNVQVPFSHFHEFAIFLAVVGCLFWRGECHLDLPVTTLRGRVRIRDLFEAVAIHEHTVPLKMRSTILSDFFTNAPVLAVW